MPQGPGVRRRLASCVPVGWGVRAAERWRLRGRRCPRGGAPDRPVASPRGAARGVAQRYGGGGAPGSILPRGRGGSVVERRPWGLCGTRRAIEDRHLLDRSSEHRRAPSRRSRSSPRRGGPGPGASPCRSTACGAWTSSAARSGAPSGAAPTSCSSCPTAASPSSIRIERTPEGFAVTDLGSSNGTFLGGSGAGEPVTLATLATPSAPRAPLRAAPRRQHRARADRRRRADPRSRAASACPGPRRRCRRLRARPVAARARRRPVAAAAPARRDGDGEGGPRRARSLGAPGPVRRGQLRRTSSRRSSSGTRRARSRARCAMSRARAAAHEGTLFLDEIGDLPPIAQASLLRVLQEGEVTLVGAVRPVKIDARATHQPLPDRVASGSFRADLFARLAGFSLEVPAARPAPRRGADRLLLPRRRRARAPRRRGPRAPRPRLPHERPARDRRRRDPRGRRRRAPRRSARVPHAARRRSPGRRSPRPLAPAAPLDDAAPALRDELAERLRASGNNLTQVAREARRASRCSAGSRFGLKAR